MNNDLKPYVFGGTATTFKNIRFFYIQSKVITMASPQKENGYTTIANELLEAIYRRKFTASQLKILMFIMRFTYGFNRKTASLSNSFISNGTGIHEITVSKEINTLINDNVIELHKKPSFHDSRVIGINKDYEGWSNHLELASALRVSENSDRVSVQVNLGLASGLTKKRKNTNTNIKKEKEKNVLSDEKPKEDIFAKRTF